VELMKRMPTVEELAAWHLQAALRGFLVRHRERKMRGLPPGHAKTCPSTIAAEPEDSEEAEAETPAPVKLRKSHTASFHTRSTRSDMEPMEQRMVALEGEVDKSHRALTGQLQEIRALLQHQFLTAHGDGENRPY
jgi:DNA-directed RNA polymerase specialized sigma24 family protein